MTMFSFLEKYLPDYYSNYDVLDVSIHEAAIEKNYPDFDKYLEVMDKLFKTALTNYNERNNIL